ncbi:hypothetical protein AURDEDRAFT_161488 [Auricularia subglabra TFB-10046 SS5]|nr:hypothetical protein AURDEDRAFT_161488 [Auricularia subglabra TFB-10046 SS5]
MATTVSSLGRAGGTLTGTGTGSGAGWGAAGAGPRDLKEKMEALESEMDADRPNEKRDLSEPVLPIADGGGGAGPEPFADGMALVVATETESGNEQREERDQTQHNTAAFDLFTIAERLTQPGPLQVTLVLRPPVQHSDGTTTPSLYIGMNGVSDGYDACHWVKGALPRMSAPTTFPDDHVTALQRPPLVDRIVSLSIARSDWDTLVGKGYTCLPALEELILRILESTGFSLAIKHDASPHGTRSCHVRVFDGLCCSIKHGSRSH